MRNFVIYITIIIFCSCSEQKYLYFSPRTQYSYRDTSTSRAHSNLDHSLYFCALDFEPSYDWTRDSSFGAVSYSLCLYKDYSLGCKIDSDCGLIRPDPDTHHIIAGHLYTEAVKDANTIIAKDGVEQFRLSGSYVLKGLVPTPAGLYMLTQDIITAGVALWLNDELISDLGEVRLFGDLFDPSYAPTGALYVDNNELCYAYTRGNKVYLCHNESTIEFSDSQIQDIKMIDGNPRYVNWIYGTLRVVDARIWRDKSMIVSARYRDFSLQSGISIDKQNIVRLELNSPQYYISGQDYAYIDEFGEASISVSGSVPCDGEYEGYSLINPACAYLYNQSFYAALSPNDEGLYPIIIHNQKQRRVAVHGYISNIEVVGASPPD